LKTQKSPAVIDGRAFRKNGILVFSMHFRLLIQRSMMTDVQKQPQLLLWKRIKVMSALIGIRAVRGMIRKKGINSISLKSGVKTVVIHSKKIS